MDDPPIPEAIRLVERLTEDHTVILLTARPSGSADTTLEWLGRHGVNWDLLAMRNQNDHGSSPEVKRAILSDLRSDGYEPVLAIDDDPREPGHVQVRGRSDGLRPLRLLRHLTLVRSACPGFPGGHRALRAMSTAGMSGVRLGSRVN